MAKESFMLVSLKGDKAKKLAQVMANPTCTKILEYLAGKDATESQVAKDLGMPLSTVHYNLQQLVDAKLVVIDEFHYSEKGREVNHYKLANKYIIIAPQEEDPSFLANLKKYIPVTILVLGFSVIIKTMQFLTPGQQMAAFTAESDTGIAAIVPEAAPEAARAMKTGEADGTVAIQAAQDALESADAANVTEESLRTLAAPENFTPPIDTIAPPAHSPWWQSQVIDYFIAGAVFVLLVIVVIEAINYWRSKRH